MNYAGQQCEHAQTELRARRIHGGGIQYRRQCLRCGGSASNAISHTEVPVFPPMWDDALASRWDEQRSEYWRQQRAEFERGRADRKTAYHEYLLTPEWKERRSAVLRRDRFICQGCLEARATEVHHRSYRSVFSELLFDLVSVCKECHTKAHAGDSDDA